MIIFLFFFNKNINNNFGNSWFGGRGGGLEVGVKDVGDTGINHINNS